MGNERRRQRIRLLPAAVGSLLVAAAACSLTDLDGLSNGPSPGGPDGSPEAGNDDASLAEGASPPVADAGDEARSSCKNLLLNPGFEEKTDCQPWTSGGNTAELGDPAFRGAHACRVCATGGEFHFATVPSGSRFAPGDRIRVGMFVRAVDSAEYAERLNLYITRASFLPGGSTGTGLLTYEYQELSAVYDFPPDAASEQGIHVQLYQQTGDAGRCLLVDEASVCLLTDGG